MVMGKYLNLHCFFFLKCLMLNYSYFSSHCAGTIGGKKYGVAKKSIPVAVKVLASNGSGSMSDVVKGVDWATNEYLKDKKAALQSKKPFKGSAANMSLGGGKSPSLDATVNGAVEAGLVFAVAAGNDNKDAW